MYPVYVYRTPSSSFRCAAPASWPWKASCRGTTKKEEQEEKKEEIGVAAEEELAPERELVATEGGSSRRGPCRPSAHQRRPQPAAKGVCPPPHRPHTAIMIRMILVTPRRQLVWPKSDAGGACKRTGPHPHTHCTRRRQVGAAPSCRPRARYRDIRLSAAPAARARAFRTFRTVYSDAGLGGERLVRAPRILAPP